LPPQFEAEDEKRFLKRGAEGPDALQDEIKASIVVLN
jgi:hypothetical protein